MARSARTVFAAATGTAALAGLLFGFDTAVISGVTQAVESHFALSQVQLGTTVSAALWGTLLGAATVGLAAIRSKPVVQPSASHPSHGLTVFEGGRRGRTRSRRPHASFMDRMNDRWDRRNDDR